MVSRCCVQGSTYKITLEKKHPLEGFSNLCWVLEKIFNWKSEAYNIKKLRIQFWDHLKSQQNLVHGTWLYQTTWFVGEECDINPLIASEESILALDARVLLYDVAIDDVDLPQPSIRPYPHQPLGSCISFRLFGAKMFQDVSVGWNHLVDLRTGARCEGTLGIQTSTVTWGVEEVLLMEEIRLTSWQVVCPIVYRDFTCQVVQDVSHQQYKTFKCQVPKVSSTKFRGMCAATIWMDQRWSWDPSCPRMKVGNLFVYYLVGGNSIACWKNYGWKYQSPATVWPHSFWDDVSKFALSPLDLKQWFPDW